MMLLLNIFAPTTTDVRVIKYVVPIVSQVGAASSKCRSRTTGRSRRVTCCSASIRRPIRTRSHALEAQLVSEEAKVGAERAQARRIAGAPARRAVDGAPAERAAETGDEPGRGAQARSTWPASASRRTRSSPPPVPATVSISNRRRPTSSSSTAQIAAARAAEQEIREKLSGRVKGLRRRRGGQGADHHRQSAVRVVAGASGNDARPARKRAMEPGTDDGASHRRTARWSTSCSGPASSSPACRSTK